MDNGEDPRIFFAAERTLLAWVRTGLTVIGLGFVVARFGLFLRIVRNDTATSSSGSTAIGVGLVILGATAVGFAAWQHLRFCRALHEEGRPKPYFIHWSIWFAFGLAGIGIILAVYLLMRSSIE